MKIHCEKDYFKFELGDGECTYQGVSQNIIEAKEMFLRYLSDKIDNEIGNMMTSYCTIKKQMNL